MTAMRLGTSLLRDGHITLTQLELALRAQVSNGGRLGTNLVEQGFVTLDALTEHLGTLLNCPPALVERLEAADRGLLDKVGAEFASRQCVVVMDWEPSGTTIGVATCDPEVPSVREGLESLLGHPVTFYVAPELRLFYYLERHYGIRRRARFARARTEEQDNGPLRRERRATQPLRGGTNPLSFSRPPSIRHIDPPSADHSFAEVLRRLDKATSREAVVQSILDYSLGRFHSAIVFMIREAAAIGIRAQAPGVGPEAVERLALDLRSASVLQEARDRMAPYRGPANTAGKPIEREIWDFLALDFEPRDLHVVPIRGDAGLLQLVYAHAHEGNETSKESTEGLVEICGRAQTAYGRLMAQSLP